LMGISDLGADFLSIGWASNYYRILAEERSCLALLGDGYGDYMARVLRYLQLFWR
jgi:protein-S-isoprenylcysteine O-methyltransferase Ste14